MTVKDCYEAIGADYQEVLRRLANEERVKRFLLKFPGMTASPDWLRRWKKGIMRLLSVQSIR